MKKIHLIAAARPNFMKIAPLYHELVKREGLDPIIVHTVKNQSYGTAKLHPGLLIVSKKENK